MSLSVCFGRVAGGAGQLISGNNFAKVSTTSLNRQISCSHHTLLFSLALLPQIVAIAGRQLSTGGGGDNSGPKTAAADIKKSVFISQSSDVFANLALEDWIYKNYDLSAHHVLMLWANDPCVVIGRHQNPFGEANVSRLCREGVTLARRNSGGGAVYHDRGNLNCTFFTARERYNRTYNLNIITRALFREYGINAQITERDDITVLGKKVRREREKRAEQSALCTVVVLLFFFARRKVGTM